MERTPVGSDISSGNGVTWLLISDLGLVGFVGFEDFLDLKNFGEKQDVGTMHEGCMHEEGSMQDGWMQKFEFFCWLFDDEDEFTIVGLNVQRRERSKSESMM